MQYISKKNTVYKKDTYVIKEFTYLESLQREYSMIKLLRSKKIAVPKILYSDEKSIHYEHIEGVLYIDLCETMTQEQAIALISWIHAYHEVTNASRPDVNLRNFIYCPTTKSCVGIDFEDSTEVLIQEKDFGRMFAFIACYEPIFSVKKEKTCKMLYTECEKIALNPLLLKKYYLEEIQAMKERRKNSNLHEDVANSFWENIKYT